MDMNAIDIGTILAIAGLLYKTTQDKIAQAEEMGKLKQQVKSLETKTNQIEIDEAFLKRRIDAFKKMFPNLDTVGWYSTGSE